MNLRHIFCTNPRCKACIEPDGNVEDALLGDGWRRVKNWPYCPACITAAHREAMRERRDRTIYKVPAQYGGLL